MHSGKAVKRPSLGTYLSRHFGEQDVHVLRTSAHSKIGLDIYRKRSSLPILDEITAPAVEEGFLVAIALAPYVQVGGQACLTRRFSADSVQILDLTQEFRGYLRTSFDILFLHVTRAALSAVAQEMGATRVAAGLTCPAGRIDPVAASLGRALLCSLSNPDEAQCLFVDQVGLALSLHLAQHYGGLNVPEKRAKGGLSTLQARRAKDYLLANIGGDVSIATAAEECGLSRSHFTKAFKETTGRTPHRWLLEQRLQAVKDMLRAGGDSIAEIALACGFSDQSHLTRLFSREVGIPPGNWRREQGG